MSSCYAAPQDGNSWGKPNLQMVGCAGNTDNNIIREGPHGSGVYYDCLAGADCRYKMLMVLDGKLQTAVSEDGLTWVGVRPTCVEAKGDTHTQLWWGPAKRTDVGQRAHMAVDVES